MVHVIATIELKPGCREDFLKQFHRVMPLVHAEKGCLEYGPAVDLPAGLARQIPEREDVVVVIEKWASLDDLKAHTQAPHMAEYRTWVKDFVVNVQLQILQPA